MRILSFLLAIALVACGESELSQRQIMRGKAIKAVAKKMRRDGLFAVGAGGGESGGKTNLTQITFRFNQHLTIDEGRRLIVKSIDTLLDIINSDPKNEQYYVRFPVTPKYLNVGILAPAPAEEELLNHIVVVSNIKNSILYYTYDPEGIKKPHLELHRESIEEAREIVAQECASGVKQRRAKR